MPAAAVDSVSYHASRELRRRAWAEVLYGTFKLIQELALPCLTVVFAYFTYCLVTEYESIRQVAPHVYWSAYASEYESHFLSRCQNYISCTMTAGSTTTTTDNNNNNNKSLQCLTQAQLQSAHKKTPEQMADEIVQTQVANALFSIAPQSFIESLASRATLVSFASMMLLSQPLVMFGWSVFASIQMFLVCVRYRRHNSMSHFRRICTHRKAVKFVTMDAVAAAAVEGRPNTIEEEEDLDNNNMFTHPILRRRN